MEELYPLRGGFYTPKEMLRYILYSRKLNQDDYVYIILGKTGPTGKTWLCENLKTRGYKAVEWMPHLDRYISCVDLDNRLIVDEENRFVIIILNEILPEFKSRPFGKPIIF